MFSRAQRSKIMALQPRDPFEALLPLREAMNRLFEESFVGPRFELFSARVFPIDVYEWKDQRGYVIEAALPGFKPEEIQVTAQNHTLTIRAERKAEEKGEKGTYLRSERSSGAVSRSITLPTLVEADLVEATYEHGILTLRVPRHPEVASQAIPVKVKETAGKS
jgi:HSP20 family protein